MASYDNYDYGYTSRGDYGQRGRDAYGGTRQGGQPYDRQREINEAIMAGERALAALKKAETDLGTARIAGVFDLFGGGFLTSLFKHSKLDDARRDLENAKYELRRFGDELDDVTGIGNLNIDVGGFLTLADFLFDGLFADYFVQSKINEARGQVAEAIRRVEDALRRLRTA